MPPDRPRVLLVGVLPGVVASLQSALGPGADVLFVEPGQLAEHTQGVPGERRPTLVVLGRELSLPTGLVHTVRPHPEDLVVLVVTGPEAGHGLATLPLLFSADQVRRVPAGQADRVPELARDMLIALGRRRSYAAARSAAQHRLSAGRTINRQLGDQLFGEFLTQAPVGALMLDASGALAAWNNRAAGILGLTDPGSLGQALTALFPAEVRPELERHLATAGGGRAGEPETVFERARSDGTGQALRLAPQQVLDGDGQERLLLLVEDVTDRLRAQHQLAERTGHALLSAEVAAAMTAPGPMEERLGRCVRAAADRLAAVFACVWVVRAPGDRPEHLVCAEDPAEEGGVPGHVRVREALMERVTTGRRPVTERIPGSVPGEADTICVGLPLVAGGELLGALAVSAVGRLSYEARAALEGIADQIAVGIRQDRLVERLRASTRALERPLLPPHLPTLPGFDLAARYRPHGSGQHIGGDFYDAFTAADGRHVLVLGDVCGKGPAAAAITGLVRHTLWAAAQTSLDAGHVLGLVDRALRRQNTPFCTLAYVVLEPGPAPVRMRLASAGHPAPLLRRADGSTEPLDVRGPLLGALPEVRHPVTEAELLPGDTLVLYTDGFTEGGGSYRQREPEDLAAVVAGQPLAPDVPEPADRLAGALVADAHDWWDGDLRDDLAVLALSALPPGAPGTATER
ncbi:SpoIIE family protein phosphatase [Streptomyces zingiberis]|uniref:SpoIIE family protein phosphatase n=1 Tax=Streptomyces zingiberis TaxID=2053010 RepID=A0ABX1BSJ2_9ACTN|nr:SpoIIE family protein phosphatase [Streptomyces zingiberis]NJP99509.1 SpoIIE family protein phosphatase [Streptomyces zingiberis]